MAEAVKTFKEMTDRLKKDKKAFITVIIGLSGMFLILLSELPAFTSTEKADKQAESFYSSQELEAEVEKLISRVRGAGKVNVMLTYESNEEKIFAKDTETRLKGENESQNSDKHIVVDSADGETGLVIKTIYPKVRGVAVVCSGGDDPVVKSEISALISALFDIGSNRISIARRAEQE